MGIFEKGFQRPLLYKRRQYQCTGRNIMAKFKNGTGKQVHMSSTLEKLDLTNAHTSLASRSNKGISITNKCSCT